MPKFEVKMINIYSGIIEAESEEDAIRKLQDRNDFILDGIDPDISFEDTIYRIGIEAQQTIF